MKPGFILVFLLVFMIWPNSLLATDGVDNDTNEFLNIFFKQNENNKQEIEEIKMMFMEEVASEKIPLSVIQFVAKMINREMKFDSPAQAADYLLKIVDETDIMIRRGYDPAKIQALVQLTTRDRDIAAAEIQKRIQNRYHSGEDNLKKQFRKGQNDRGENKIPSDQMGNRYGKENETSSPGPKERR
ncbi:MAG: hypothetical protein JXR70_12140 [Spirochaetales bacterium]|nr:hypothetical protein [Spirochaetales bacterium]